MNNFRGLTYRAVMSKGRRTKDVVGFSNVCGMSVKWLNIGWIREMGMFLYFFYSLNLPLLHLCSLGLRWLLLPFQGLRDYSSCSEKVYFKKIIIFFQVNSLHHIIKLKADCLK